MIRELTKSALSFSWAMSLLGAEQAVNLFRPGQRNRDNFSPVAQAAASQLDESIRGIYRTGDNVQRGMVDMAFSLLNPAGWASPGTWTKMAGAVNPQNWMGASDGVGKGASSMMNPMSWMNPANFMRSMTDRTPFGSQPQTAPNPSPSQSSSTVGAGTPVAKESSSAGWGPMPSDS